MVSNTHHDLVDVHAATSSRRYVAELWERRGYVWYVAHSALRQRQAGTVFGNFWHLLNPALSIAVYYLIFGKILGTDRGVNNFLVFLAVGLFVFQFTQRSVTQGAQSIIMNRGLVRAIRFPRALLPISVTLTETIATMPTFAVAYAVALLLGEPIRWTWALFPLIGLWQACFNLGAAMIAARITTHFRDTQQFLPFFFRLLLYGSGVIFSVEEFVGDRGLELLFVANPMYGFISIARWAIMGTSVAPDVVIATAAWTIVLFVGGFFWFKAAEGEYHRV